MLAKASRGGFDAASGDLGDESPIERFGQLGRRGGHETRPPPFAGIAQQRELADHEHRAAGVRQGQVHFSFGVVEDPQAHDLVGQLPRIVQRVVGGHAQQHQQSAADLAADFTANLDPRFEDSLHACPHKNRSVRRPPRIFGTSSATIARATDSINRRQLVANVAAGHTGPFEEIGPMHPLLLLAAYSVVFVAGSLVGGWVPMVFKLTHRRMQIAISFVSGMILGIGILHLLPHSFESLGSIDKAVAWTLVGFLFMFFLERFFHFHHHEVGDEAAAAREALLPSQFEGAAHDHDHDAGLPKAHHHHIVVRPAPMFAWSGAAIGLTLHSLVDGVAVAAAVRADDVAGAAAWAGAGAALAVGLHKPFDALSIGTLMAAAGRSTRSRHWMTALYALVTPLGAFLFYAFASQLSESRTLGPALGFAAGAFLCIATSDLLPELQFHRHDRLSLSVALLAGIALAWSTIYLEGDAHHHGAHQDSAHEDAAHSHELEYHHD